MEPAKIVQPPEAAVAEAARREGSGAGITGSSPRATKFILILLQIFILLSVFHLTWQALHSPGERNATVTYLLSVLAIMVAYFVLAKFQFVIEDFTLKSEKLERHLEERTDSLLKINEEMRSEINERKRVEAALNESEGFFRAIIREAATGIAIIDEKGILQEANPVLHRMLGHDPQGLQGIAFTQLLLPGDAPQSDKHFNELLHGYATKVQTEERLVRKDGRIIWGRQSVSLVRDISGAPKFFITMIEDVTEARQAEEKIRSYQDKLQSLASELSLSEERERRTLAGMLHDHTGQMLCMAKIKLEEMENAVPEGSLQSLKEIQGMIEKSINYTRSLIYELSPPILYDVGFEAAVEWLAEDLRRQHQLPIIVSGDGQADQLDHEVRHFLFRAVRELLFNVIKHARATRVEVKIERI